MSATVPNRWCSADALIAILATALAWPVHAPGQGYRIRGNAVVVETRRHWDHWQIPAHLVQVEPAGSVRSRNFRKVYNLLDDLDFSRSIEMTARAARVMNADSTLRINVDGNPALDAQGNPVFDYVLRPGISRVGSNPGLASNIIDGDPATFWEPDPDDPIETWWIEVDLARGVPVERLRLRFVDEELGDPFLRFVLFMEQKQLPLRDDGHKLNFATFIPFKGINRDRRLFVIESAQTSGLLPPVTEGRLEDRLSVGRASTDWTGRLIETIRIQITDTRGSRAEAVTEAEWNELPPSERGDVVHFVRDVAGREEQVDAATYESLEESRRGRRDYYRRELPRLAEIDAWGWGDNVAQGLLKTGGSVTNTLGLGAPENAYDGELSSFYRHTYFDEALPNHKLVNTDLGGTIWLEQVRVVTQGYHQAPPARGYILRASSGVRDAQGRLKYEQISDESKERNADAGLFQVLNNVLDPARPIRFLEFLTLKNKAQGSSRVLAPGIGEFLVYSEGPPAEAILESDIIELPRRVDLGAISWEADTPPGTRVEIRTRTGDQLRRRIRYFDKAGGEKTEKVWQGLLFFAKGPSDTSFVPGSGWSPWSQRYESPGDRVTSPALRRYLQIQARLLADYRAEPPALGRIRVEFRDPVVQDLAAELWPRDVQVGVVDTFAVWIRAMMVERPAAEASPGFDEVLVRSRPSIDLRLIDVEVGTEDELRRGEPFRRYDRRDGSTLAGAAGASLEVVQDGGDSLRVRFQRTVALAPAEVTPRQYYRALSEGDEVLTRTDGTLLSATSHQSLPEAEKGPVMYFRLEADGTHKRVSASAWEALPEAQRGPVRYYRIVGDVGEQTPLDALGDTLTLAAYRRLPAAERGQVVGPARLIRLRVAATVFLHATELSVAARRGPDAPWQAGDAADVTDLTPGRDLVLSALGARAVLGDMSVSPNPFTPNGDGVNDRSEIAVNLFRVFDPRPLKLTIYTLNGRRVQVLDRFAAGGRHVFEWDGRDRRGNLVPPGLYLVQVEADLDRTQAAGRRDSRVVAVVY